MLPFRPALRPGALAAGLVLLLGTPAGAQSDILLQLESGSPTGDRFVVDSAGGFVARGTFDRGTIPATGIGVRLMWYPGRGAFRAGRVTGIQWSDANVGSYSVATGYNTTASGYGSTAMGDFTSASGVISTAMGYVTTASGEGSSAMGGGTTASGSYSTAMGSNTTASGQFSTAMGHSTTASGQSSTAMGYATTASGIYSTAMGEGTRAGGQNSTAMGRRASTQGFSGSFVYGDATTAGDTVRASANQQATWRTTGGFRIFTNTALTVGVTLASGGGSWSSISDRNRKEAFAEVDGEGLLARIRRVPVTSWRYIAEEDRAVRHIGPMAQDWAAAFPELGGDGTTINSGDLDGVSLAAVQALDGRTRGVPEMEERIRALEAENAGMRADAAEQRTRLERLEARLAALAAEP
jgi:trimeric autotransporter adhesin